MKPFTRFLRFSFGKHSLHMNDANPYLFYGSDLMLRFLGNLWGFSLCDYDGGFHWV
jgi:hypothetical protein